jgi:hypothetical protein
MTAPERDEIPGAIRALMWLAVLAVLVLCLLW